MNFTNELKAMFGRMQYYYNRADECALNKQIINLIHVENKKMTISKAFC